MIYTVDNIKKPRNRIKTVKFQKLKNNLPITLYYLSYNVYTYSTDKGTAAH